ncbi:MAG: class I SAM-dependent methyltransferase [Cyanobacteria bacterium]|nr:class I SAM-dependent methyltransferase [Cyanobacteriota bacterium]
MIDIELYQKNLAFWEDAWARVKKANTNVTDVLDYIPEIPLVFKEHDCKRILDIACGSGWLSFFLNEQGFEVVGVDISASAIRLANEVVAERKLNTVQFIQADMFAMDFPENSFDGILINACFEHLDYDRGAEFLQMIKKYLKPDGIMFGVFDKVASGKRGSYEVLEDGSHQYNDEYRDGMLLRYYNDEELEFLLQETNWQVISNRKNKHESRIVIAKNIRPVSKQSFDVLVAQKKVATARNASVDFGDNSDFQNKSTK